MASITGLLAREILDSRGLPTVECSIWLDTGHFVTSAASTGTSRGKYESAELRDGDTNRMVGKGVLNAVSQINTLIAPQLMGKDPTQQEELDQLLITLDGTKNKEKLGGNATIAVSQAILKAGAVASNLPLYYYIQQKYQLTESFTIPTCIYTMINGGAHGADNLDIQEFQLVPASHVDFPTSLNMAVTLYQKLEEVLISKGAVHSVGIVGGFTPNLFNNTDAFEILVETIKATPFTFAQDIFFGADIAATNLFSSGKYTLKDKQQPYSSKELLEYYKSLRNAYHVFYIEDPFQEDDIKSWQQVTADLGQTTMIVSDSLTATNPEKVTKAISDKVANTLLVKPDQVGTISETVEVIKKAKEAQWQVVISHRSGETADDFLSDFSVGVGANYTKFGPPNGGERVAKYNRLIQIHHDLYIRPTEIAQQAQAMTDQAQVVTDQAQATTNQAQPGQNATNQATTDQTTMTTDQAATPTQTISV